MIQMILGTLGVFARLSRLVFVIRDPTSTSTRDEHGFNAEAQKIAMLKRNIRRW